MLCELEASPPPAYAVSEALRGPEGCDEGVDAPVDAGRRYLELFASTHPRGGYGWVELQPGLILERDQDPLFSRAGAMRL